MDDKNNSRIKTANYVVAYFDICGFKNFIEKEGSKGTEALSFLENRLLSLQRNVNDHGTIQLSIKQYSDSVFLWYEFNETVAVKQIKTLFLIISTIQYELFSKYGLCIRGGISKGVASVSNGMISGKAINEAYKIESKVANWYRVAVSHEVVKIFKTLHDVYLYKDSSDELCTVNFLMITCLMCEGESKYPEILGTYRKMIVSNFYNEEDGTYFINPKEEKTLGGYIEAEKIIVRYHDLILYYDLICDILSCSQCKVHPTFVPNVLVAKKQLDDHLNNYDGGSPLLINDALRSLLTTFNNRR